MRRLRRIIQIVCTVIGNGYVAGFARGSIFTGGTKVFCVPFFNCYSCPGALGACPVGSLQAVIGDRNFRFSFYVLGLLMLFGIFMGRLVCGFLCPFGFIQELLNKIKSPEIKIPEKADRVMRYFKYAVLLVLVILLPLVLTDSFGTGAPYFCKWLCPAGTLEGGIPLVIANESLRRSIGFLFSWKMALLVITVVASIMIHRPFCKYVCPLGAFYGLFNRFSFFKMSLDREKCTGCGACERICQMNVRVRENCNSAECIRCGECKSVCSAGAIKMGMEFIDKGEK